MWTEVEYYDDFIGQWSAEAVVIGSLARSVELDITADSLTIVADGAVWSGNYHVRQYQMIIGWSVNINGYDILLMDAELEGDRLFMRWKPQKQYYPITQTFIKQ
jgi:hypothetical protein